MPRSLTLAAALLALALTATPATPAAAGDDEFQVVPRCEWALKTLPTGGMVYVLIAEAHATGPTPAVMTTVECVATTLHGERLEARGNSLGPDAYAARPAYLPRFDVPQTCGWASALFAGDPDPLLTHTVDTGEPCP